jgi:hypothetical protein
MENLNISRAIVLTGPHLGDRDSRYRLGVPAYLKGRGSLLIVAAVLGATGVFAGWQWFGAAAMLPLLYTLPCAAMMMMCMRGHGGMANTPTNSNSSSTESEPDKTQ